MRIFLTGGTGFIGSHLLAELLRAGHEVVALRRCGSEPVIQLDQQPCWLERSLFQLTVKELAQVDVVVHLASAGVSPQLEGARADQCGGRPAPHPAGPSSGCAALYRSRNLFRIRI